MSYFCHVSRSPYTKK
jgi:hypothetical protein